MAKSSVVARVLEGDRLECQIGTPGGDTLTLVGATTAVAPLSIDGAEELRSNRSLVSNAWSFSKFTYLKVNLPTEEEQKAAGKRAAAHRDVAEWIADLVDDLGRTTTGGWCSGCFTDADHRKVKDPAGPLPAYLCSNCGTPTLPCPAPNCENMAIRGQGAIRVPRYCAEHRHEIPGFAKAEEKMGRLEEYRSFLEYDKPHLSKTTKLVGIAVAGIATGGAAAFAAAPAIGGAVGTLVGSYSGAAATSYGLALLGGGSVAAGGLGVFGGTLVVAAVGCAVGGTVGATVTNAYLREDSSFAIEMVRDGDGVPVIVCNGFLSEGATGWGEWRDIVRARYPDSPVYRVTWGSKELKDLGMLATFTALKTAAPTALKQAALSATKAGAKKLGPLAPLLLAGELAKNPWHVARNRADKTGVIVADLLARSTADAYVLVGHSLGARAMAVAAQAIGTKSDGPRLQAVHLTGAAIRAKGDWANLTARVDDAVYNYHSANDNVLKYLYAGAELGQKAAGLVGFSGDDPKLKNIDVSEQVECHSDYYSNVTFL